MKQIPLTRGMFALVDDEDYEFLMQFKWHAKHTNYENYYACHSAWNKETKKKHDVYLHRLIMNTPKGMDCDHEDGVKLNCQKYNLRNCSHKNNMENMGRHKDCSSQYKGVSFIKQTGKWRARIFYENKEIRLGHFNTELEAAIAHDEGILKYKPKYGRLNFPKEKSLVV